MEGAEALSELASLREAKARRSLGRLWSYARPHRGTLLLAALSMVLSAISGMAVVYQIQYVLGEKVIHAATVGQGLHLMLAPLGLLLLVATALMVFSFAAVFLTNRGVLKVIRDMRVAMFEHLHTLSLSFYDRAKTGELSSRLVNDTTVLQYSLTQDLPMLVISPVAVVVGLVMMFQLSWRVSLAAFVVVPIVTAVTTRLGRLIRRITAQTQEAVGSMQALVQEDLSGIRTIKCFNLEQREGERFGGESQEVYRMGMRNARTIGILQPFSEWVAVIGFVVVAVVGAVEMIRGRLSYPVLLTLALIIQRAGSYFNKGARQLAVLQQAAAIVDRIFQVLDLPPETSGADASADGKALPALVLSRGHVQFDGVSFGYANGEEVLHQVSFEARPGQMIGVAGPSGSGKTTVVSLIPRLYRPSEGRITIDGQDIAQVSLPTLRSQIGVVAQDDFLFSDAIRENIRLGRPDAADEEVEAAARAANAHDFIMSFPRGYDTHIGERGVTISGGQRQRIAIARALLRNPRLLILDEATSALDAESEAQVYQTLAQWKGDRTILIVAHRLSTLTRADEILVFEGGRLVERGNHAELLARDGLFASLHRLQAQEEEAEARAEG